MKLRYFPTSPYVRKVMVVAIEAGLEGRIERIPTDPWDPETDLVRDNPLGKVPTLITDDGKIIFNSPVICEYLDSLNTGRRLFPPTGEARWTALRQQALGDGILDAAVLRRVENKREAHLRSADWIVRQKGVVERGLATLEREVAEIRGNPITIGHISIGCALGYLDLRFPEDNWREANPALASWYADFLKRPSMVATVPRESN